MTNIREQAQTIIRDFDNETSFVILLSAAVLPYLEKPINRARFFEYNKKLELYFSPKDLNRFSRLKALFEHIGDRVKSNKLVGFERLLMLITGIQNIRDVIPFPRTPNSIEF